MVDIQFWTTLVKVATTDDLGLAALRANCTHVTGPYWIMEGEVDCLRDAGVRLREVAEGAVGCLGGLTEDELKRVCRDSYGGWSHDERDAKR